MRPEGNGGAGGSLGYNGRMLGDLRWKEIFAEAALLSAALIAVAATAVAFQHAAIGLPLIGAAPPPVSRALPMPLRAELLASTRAPDPIAALLLPSHVYLGVPFTAQAPFGDWSPPYAEACEEASVAMAMAWVRGEALDPAGARREILRQVAFENYHFGYNHDTALRETAKIISRFYGYAGARAVYGIAADDIRRELASGNLVLLPVAGELLANPAYISPPPYHMLVVHGYDDAAQEFIVNDPGTRHGANYRYPYQTLWEAVHDWGGSDATILAGQKGMIVVQPPST